MCTKCQNVSNHGNSDINEIMFILVLWIWYNIKILKIKIISEIENDRHNNIYCSNKIICFLKIVDKIYVFIKKTACNKIRNQFFFYVYCFKCTFLIF